MQERANREIKRRAKVVQSFPSRGSLVRLVGAVLLGEEDAWSQRRMFSREVTAEAWNERRRPVPTELELKTAERRAADVVAEALDQAGQAVLVLRGAPDAPPGRDRTLTPLFCARSRGGSCTFKSAISTTYRPLPTISKTTRSTSCTAFPVRGKVRLSKALRRALSERSIPWSGATLASRLLFWSTARRALSHRRQRSTRIRSVRLVFARP